MPTRPLRCIRSSYVWSQVGELKDAGMAARFDALQRELNALPTVDYERVNRAKSEYLHAVYRDRARATFRSREFQSFMQANEDWLRPYAVFCALRDEHSTPDFCEMGLHGALQRGQSRKV